MSLFDQLGKIVANPGTQTAPETDRAAYLGRLEQSKAEIEQRISGLFAELGKAYYESHADGQQTEYEAQMSAIRAAYADIAQCEKQAGEIAARRRCPSCGAELVEGSLFCNFCGTKLATVQPPADSTDSQGQKVCPKCKTPIGPDDLFCIACGADLRNS